MSDGSLSQDEIDALLQGGGGMDFGGGDMGGGPSGPALNDQQRAAFAEVLMGNLSTQASNLSGMLGKDVAMTNLSVEFLSRDELLSQVDDEVVEVKVDFTEGFSCPHIYLMTQNLAAKVAGLMMGQEDVELNEAALSALEEAGNTLAGSLATVLGDKAGSTVMTSPASARKTLKANLSLPDSPFVKAVYTTNVNGSVEAEMIEIFALPPVETLVGGAAEPAPAMDLGAAMGGMNMGGQMGGMNMGGSMGGQMGAPMGGQMGGMNMGGQMGGMPAPGMQSIQFPNLVPQQSAGDSGNIGLLMDVSMEMTVELGRTRRLIREILGMGEGTIIELDKLAGEPVDILVNHKLIAKGEVVVIDENFGVRVTEIISPMDRVSELT